MDKVTAGEVAESKLQSVLKQKPQVIKALLDESEHCFIVNNGVEYQLRVNAFYENSRSRIAGKIAVIVSVDDQGFWSTFIPLCRSAYYYLHD